MPPPGGSMEEARRLATVLRSLEERLAATGTLEEVKGVLTELIQGLREAIPSLFAATLQATPQDSGRGAWRTIGGRPFGPPQGGPREREGESPWTLDRPYGHLFGGGSEPKGR